MNLIKYKTTIEYTAQRSRSINSTKSKKQINLRKLKVIQLVCILNF